MRAGRVYSSRGNCQQANSNYKMYFQAQSTLAFLTFLSKMGISEKMPGKI